MVAHDARKSSPVRLRSAIGDHLVVHLPREREVCHAVKLPVPERPTDEPVDGERRNPKPAPAQAAPSCLLVGAGPAKNLTRPSSLVRRSFGYSSRKNFAVLLVSLQLTLVPSLLLWACLMRLHGAAGKAFTYRVGERFST